MGTTMTKQTIITIALCMIICGTYAQSNTTKLVIPSAATTTAKGQMDTQDTAVTAAQSAVTAAQTAMGLQAKATAVLSNDMSTQSMAMSTLVAAAAKASAAYRMGQAKAMMGLAGQAAAANALKRATQMTTCANGLNTWASAASDAVQKTTVVAPAVSAPITWATYTDARAALVVPTSFSGLLTALTAKTADHNTWLTTKLAAQLQIMVANMKLPYTVGGADSQYVTDKNAWTKFKTECVTADITAGGATSICPFASFKAWALLMDNLVLTSGPGFYLSKGKQAAWVAFQSQWTASGGSLVSLYATVSSGLNGAIADVAAVMSTYKTQADLLKNALSAAVQAVGTDVANDEKTLANNGVTAKKANTMINAGLLVTSTQGTVTTAMTPAGVWGLAVAAVKTARGAVASQTAALGPLVNAQVTAQTVVNNAQKVNDVAQARSTAADALKTNMGLVLVGWQATDGKVSTIMAAATQALATQKNSTQYLINPPKKALI